MVPTSGACSLHRVFLLSVTLIGFLLGSVVGEAAAQEGTVQVEENLRAEPSGAVVARLSPGVRVAVGDSEGSWSRVTIEGFVWAQSLQVRTSGSFDLVVAASEGENLRDSPSGAILGRLNSGTLLEEIERIPGWIRVRRTAWIWTPSLTLAPARAAESAGGAGPVTSSSLSSSAASATALAPVVTEPSLEASELITEGWVRSGTNGTRLLLSPEGDALGRIEPGTNLRIVAREGNWARVQVDGWVWMPPLAVGGETVGDPTIIRGVQIRDLSANFDRYRGRLVEVDLQFISLERAEQVRSDFYAGEPFLLARALDQERTFVYVAIPEGRLAEVQALAPLERIRIVGRARSGAAAFTGSPILDLMELARVR
jgi:SH3-like domain-containing protein